MFTWEIPPDAPKGWGKGYIAGEMHLRDKFGLRNINVRADLVAAQEAADKAAADTEAAEIS